MLTALCLLLRTVARGFTRVDVMASLLQARGQLRGPGQGYMALSRWRCGQEASEVSLVSAWVSGPAGQLSVLGTEAEMQENRTTCGGGLLRGRASGAVTHGSHFRAGQARPPQL